MKRMRMSLGWLAVVSLVVLLVPLPVWADDDSDSDSDDARFTPVGAWDFSLVDDATGAVQKALAVYNQGGTTTNTAASGPLVTFYGSWKKSGRRGLDTSFYLLVVDEVSGEHFGYVKVMAHYELEDKDTLVGGGEVWFLLGTDPFNPIDTLLLGSSQDIGRRLKAEGPS